MKARTYGFGALILLASVGCAAAPAMQRVAAYASSTTAEAAAAAISGEVLLRDISELASDRFLGRAVATAGEDSAISYIARRFREMGLEPGMPGGSYLQRVPLVATTSRVEARVQAGGRTLPWRQLEEMVTWSLRPDTLVRVDDSDIVFVGYGVVAPELGWDDFKGVDVRGKTVVMLVGDPPVPDPRDSTRLDPQVFRGAAMTYYGRWTYKYDIAAERGAAAVLLVHQTGPAGYPWSVVQGNVRERFEVEGARPHVPVEGWIQLEVARSLFGAGGHDFAALERAARTREFRPVSLGARASFHVRNAVRRVASHNVVARIPGSDPQVRGQGVLFTSHWDSFGIGRAIAGDSIYNGALDDATGVAWMLSLAKAYKSMNPAPRRSLVFVAFTAEEAGLLGARYYASHPVIPLDSTLANINMDAMNPWGRTRSLVSLGYGQTSLEDLLARYAARQGRTVVPDPEPEKGYFYRADHLELARGGVPALSFLFPGTDYVHPDPGYGERVRGAYIRDDYHKPSDEVKADWDMAGIVDDTQLTFWVGLDVANGREWPTWMPGSEFRAVRESR
ncbi:M28 family peptidase [Longimicrobium sp.]|jgi:Zn-dependent M28 family amino/carboxypeptidase|uniref:M28 family peptidase n=1 Tax=Longimicrobium sp. TaxID=2029185 RepID=UPI002F9499CF